MLRGDHPRTGGADLHVLGRGRGMGGGGVREGADAELGVARLWQLRPWYYGETNDG